MSETSTAPRIQAEPTHRRLGTRRVVIGAVIGISALLLTLLYGLTPLAIRASVIFYIAVGRIDCGVDSLRDAARSYCDLVGGPLGGLFATNIPVIQSSVLISRFTGLPPEWSYALISWLVLVGGIYGAYRFLRLLSVRNWIALVGSIAYIGSLGVFGILGFGGMLFGAALLPMLGFLMLSALRQLHRGRWRRALVWMIPWAALTVAMLFADGYTFIMGSALAGLLFLTWAWGRWRRTSTWVGFLALGGVTAAAYLLYRAAIPNAGAWGADGLDKFRAFGLDLSTLFVPSDEVWWAELLGIGRDSSELWGDGSNASYNYLGLIMIALAVIGLSLHPRRARRIVVALVAIGLIALVIALGPDLKLAAIYDAALSPSPTSMPPGAAFIDLPTAWLYEHVPGIEYMRAIYRWGLLLRFAVIVLAAVGIEALVRRRRRALAITLGILAVLEVSFNPVTVMQANFTNASEMREFNAEVLAPMSESFDGNDRLVFVSGTEKANDYLSVYLAPKLDVHTWNIGNDKALRRARAGWPSRIDVLIARQPQGDRLRDFTASVLADGTVTKVVILDFDLRNNAKSWPPSESIRSRGDALTQTIETDDRFDVDHHEYYDIVTLAD